MYSISMIGKHRMLFCKATTMPEAKERANKELKSCGDNKVEKFDYAIIYNQQDKSSIRKMGIGCDWEEFNGV